MIKRKHLPTVVGGLFGILLAWTMHLKEIDSGRFVGASFDSALALGPHMVENWAAANYPFVSAVVAAVFWAAVFSFFYDIWTVGSGETAE